MASPQHAAEVFCRAAMIVLLAFESNSEALSAPNTPRDRDERVSARAVCFSRAEEGGKHEDKLSCKATTALDKAASAASKAVCSLLAATSTDGSISLTDAKKYLSRASLVEAAFAHSSTIGVSPAPKMATSTSPYKALPLKNPVSGLVSVIVIRTLLATTPDTATELFSNTCASVDDTTFQVDPSLEVAMLKLLAGNSQSSTISVKLCGEPKSTVKVTGSAGSNLLAQKVERRPSTACMGPRRNSKTFSLCSFVLMKHDFIRDREQLAPWTSWLQPLPPLQSSPLHDAPGEACKRHIGVRASSNKVFFFFNSSTNLQFFNSAMLLQIFLFFHSLTFPAPVPVWLKQRPGSAANRSCPEVSGTHFSAPLQSAKITDVSLTERHSPDALATRPRNMVLLP